MSTAGAVPAGAAELLRRAEGLVAGGADDRPDAGGVRVDDGQAPAVAGGDAGRPTSAGWPAVEAQRRLRNARADDRDEDVVLAAVAPHVGERRRCRHARGRRRRGRARPRTGRRPAVPGKKAPGVRCAIAGATGASAASAQAAAMPRRSVVHAAVTTTRQGRRRAESCATIPSAAASSRNARGLRARSRSASQPELRRHRRATRSATSAAGVAHLARGQQPQARAAQQRVADRARLLARARRSTVSASRSAGRAGAEDRLRQLAALGGDRQHVVRRVPVAAGEPLVGLRRARPRRAAGRPRSTAWPSGISCVRHGASRASRSTSRSTVIFAIRRQVVSLPPVIVIIPLLVS